MEQREFLCVLVFKKTNIQGDFFDTANILGSALSCSTREKNFFITDMVNGWMHKMSEN